MFGFKNKFGFSFSFSRLLGISSFKSSISRKTGLPPTKNGIDRKIGRLLIDFIFNKK